MFGRSKKIAHLKSIKDDGTRYLLWAKDFDNERYPLTLEDELVTFDSSLPHWARIDINQRMKEMLRDGIIVGQKAIKIKEIQIATVESFTSVGAESLIKIWESL